MPQPLRKTYPALDLEKAQEQVRKALRAAIAECGSQSEFHRRINAELEKRGRKTISRQTMLWWLSEGTFVDEAYWEPIEHACDFRTTRRQLRPDKYRMDE